MVDQQGPARAGVPLEVHLTSKLSHPNVVHLLAHATTGAGTLAAVCGRRAPALGEMVTRITWRAAVSLERRAAQMEAPPPPESA